MSKDDPHLPIEKLYELRAKHLEMIQSIITRIAGHGATLKSFCITLVTAVCGLAVTLNRPNVTLLSLLPIVAFAIVDAQYLRTERRLRGLYEMERLDNWKTPPTFEIRVAKAPAESFLRALLSWSVLIFYIPLALGVGATFLLLEKYHGF
jgi:hypothetical protein